MAMLIAEPYAGLGNRLLCLLCSMRLAEHYGMTVRIDWSLDKYMSAPFSMLFSNSELIASEADRAAAEEVFAREDGGDLVLYLPDRVDGKRSFRINHFYYVLREAERGRGEHVAADMHRMALRLRPSPLVMARLQRFAGVDFTRSIGVHIRRPWGPDHGLTYETVSDAYYVAVVQELRRHGYDGTICLTSNSPATCAFFAQHVPDVVLTSPEDQEGLQPTAFVDALVDMILLSRCSVIVRHESTTFSKVASILGMRTQVLLSTDGGLIELRQPGV